MDLKSFKIKNHLILSGIFLGLIFHLFEKNLNNFFGGILGSILPLIFLFPLFKLKALGAGDIKLFSVIGLFFGRLFVLQSILYSFLIGGVLSMIHLIRKKQFLSRYQYLIQYTKTYFLKSSSTKIPPYYNIKEQGYTGVIHFTVAIFLGVILQLL